MGLGVPFPVRCVCSSWATPALLGLCGRLQALPETFSALFPRKLAGFGELGAQILLSPHPKFRADVEHIPHWNQVYDSVTNFLKCLLNLFFLAFQSIYIKDGVSFLLILLWLSFQIRQFLLISFCKNCSDVNFMLAHQKMRPVVVQNNTSKILLILGFSEECFIKGFQWSSFFNTSCNIWCSEKTKCCHLK